MSKNIALLVALVFLAASCTSVIRPVWVSAVVVEDSWVSKKPMSEARGNLGVATVNGKIYAIGGSVRIQSGPFAFTGHVCTNEEYDPATDTWAFKAPMPTARSGFAIAAYQGKIYCIGGYVRSGKYIGVNEVYDPATDMWETKASMPTARWLLQANVVNGKIYLIGGAGESTSINEVYNPATDSWATKAPTTTAYPISTVVDGKIYIISDNRTQIYNPETDEWQVAIKPPPYLVQGAACATTGTLAPKRIYVMGVTQLIFFGDPPPCFTCVYNPARWDPWVAVASMPTNRVNFGVAVINDTIYAVGGPTHDSIGFITPSAANEQYIPLGYGTSDTTDQSQSLLLTYAVAATAATITIAITPVALKKSARKTQAKTTANYD